MDKKNMVCLYIMKYYSAIKKRNTAICDDMNETGGHYTNWNKPYKQR